MICYKCKFKIDLTGTKLKFRDTCDNCGVDLHVCRNCKYYLVGKPNDCIVPNTEYIADREKFNFCEDFVPIEKEKEKPLDKTDISKKLFGEDNDGDSPSSFDSLFK